VNLVLKLDDNVVYAVLAAIAFITVTIATYKTLTFRDYGTQPQQHEQPGDTWHK
jgi:hypothetical protein